MDVKRKPNETVGSMMRRFSKLIQQSRVVPQIKESKFYKKRKSERQNKNRAIMREELRFLRKRLEKLGKYSEETFEEEKRKIKQKLGL